MASKSWNGRWQVGLDSFPLQKVPSIRCDYYIGLGTRKRVQPDLATHTVVTSFLHRVIVIVETILRAKAPQPPLFGKVPPLLW